jgi:endonuclease/exonuclease/phosphatase family metal-dependent hydrolase
MKSVSFVFHKLLLSFYLTGLMLFISLSACKQASSPAHTDTLRILSFNILYGGDEYDFSKTVEAIKKSGAQVVCIQEAEGQLERLANALNWPYLNKAGHIISQYPLYTHNGRGWYFTLVMPSPQRVFALSNIHLPSDPYGPDAISAGMKPDSVLALEEQIRMPMLRTYLPVWDSLIAAGMPLVITGDLNSPSHLDWVSSTVGLRPQIKYNFAWPVTKTLEKLGLQDQFRSIYPDPKAHPACTWTPGYPHPYTNPDETHDRIDYIFGSKLVKPLEATLLGEKGNPEVSISVAPYPTDHRGVISKMQIWTQKAGTGLVSCPKANSDKRNASIHTDKSSYKKGEAIEVSWQNAPGNRYDWIAVYPYGSNSKSDYYATDQASAYLLWAYTFAKPAGKLQLNASAHPKDWPLPPGKYSIHLLIDDGFESIAQTTINIH